MRRAALLASALVLGPMLGSALAGIVVLETGDTIVGAFDVGDVSSDGIVVRNPNGAPGSITIEPHRVRWWDANADAPTEAYWRAHLDEAIETRWEPARQIHLINQKPLPGEGPDAADPVIELLRGPILGQELTHAGARLRLPSGWSKPIRQPENILMAQAKEPDPSGFKPRIHVFSVETPDELPSEQLAWIERELRDMAHAEGYRTQEAYRLKQVPGGHDQMMVTLTRVPEQQRDVLALRKICFRAERTYFFAAYADAREFEEHRALFLAALETFKPGP